jgi:hypothetical protein
MVAVMLCGTVLSVDISYDFKCKSNDRNSTLIQYSHLKESGITTDYEASSFNYLANGQIKFEDSIEYLQRGDNADGNSSIYRNMDVFFEGESSISDFYAKGSYPNSNAISSRKKVWSNAFNDALTSHSWRPLVPEDLNISSPYGITNAYYSSQNSSGYSIIHVNAEVAMGSIRKRDADYNLIYDAAILDGVFSILDAAGFINNIGIKDAYWEQNALLKGNITLKNSLYYGDTAGPG